MAVSYVVGRSPLFCRFLLRILAITTFTVVSFAQSVNVTTWRVAQVRAVLWR